MDYIEYLALLGHAEYLDAQGKFAEADKTIRVAQFGGVPGGGFGGGFGNLGGMFGGRGGANPGALATGALVNQAFTGRNPLQNILGTAAGAYAFEQQRKQQSNSGKDALVQAQEKLRQLEEQLARETDPKKQDNLKIQVEQQKTAVQNLKNLPYYQTQPQSGAPQQPGAPQATQTQGAFPASAQLNTRKVFNLVASATDAASLNAIIEKNNLTPAEENLAYQIFMQRQQQGAQQQAGQPGGQQAPAAQGQITPEIQSEIVSLVMNPKIDRNTAWTNITANEKIPPALKVQAFEYFDKLKTDPRYLTPAQPATPSQPVKDPLIQEALNYMKRAPKGKKVDFLNYFAKVKQMSEQSRKAAYDQFMLENYQLPPKPPTPAPKAK